MVYPPSKDSMESKVSMFSLLHSQAPFGFRSCEGLPANAVEFILGFGGSPNEISLKFFNVFSDKGRNGNKLHGVREEATKTSFS